MKSMIKKPGIPISTYQAGLVQAKAYRALNVFMSKFLAEHDLTVSHWVMLGLLHDNRGNMPMSELASRLSVELPRVTRMVDELEEVGLTKRSGSELDARVKLVAVTEQGSALVKAVESKLRRQMKLFMHDISLPELIIYLKVLQKMAAKLDDERN